MIRDQAQVDAQVDTEGALRGWLQAGRGVGGGVGWWVRRGARGGGSDCGAWGLWDLEGCGTGGPAVGLSDPCGLWVSACGARSPVIGGGGKRWAGGRHPAAPAPEEGM
ncbi:hypothetical protein GCM10010524_49010 [Streptomyces mexicanus]